MRKFVIIALVLSITILFSSLFVVKEGQKGIILYFGKVFRDFYGRTLIYEPGLHIKIPIFGKVQYLDSRIQTMNNQEDRFVTMEKKDLIVDSYIKWKISDFSKYYVSTGGGDISKAELLLKKKFSDRLRSEFGRLNVKDIVTDSRNRLMVDVKMSLNHGTSENYQEKVSGFNYINPNFNTIKDTTNTDNERKIIRLNSVSALGIEVIDVRIKKINLPMEVSDAIYQRMRAEREAVARYHRSQGKEEAEKLKAAADYEVTRIISEAEKKALIIRGEADSETAKLYANAFNKDPSFYNFIKSLHAYENSFAKNNNIMVLNLNNEFFRFMKNPMNRK